jgi:hypothetical protein
MTRSKEPVTSSPAVIANDPTAFAGHSSWRHVERGSAELGMCEGVTIMRPLGTNPYLANTVSSAPLGTMEKQQRSCSYPQFSSFPDCDVREERGTFVRLMNTAADRPKKHEGFEKPIQLNARNLDHCPRDAQMQMRAVHKSAQQVSSFA